MKRTAHILKDATGLLGTALILGLALFMTCHAQAQDIYEIEQTFDQPFNNLEIDKGWDARLIQAPKGSPTTVVLQTRCADFFEEGNEPNIIEAKHLGPVGHLWLKENTTMPKSTVVEIHTAQPIKYLKLYKGARLTIEQYDFDSVYLDIDADTGALLVIDTLHNLGKTHISLHDATLDLRHVNANAINIWAHGNSVVNKGKQWSINQGRLYLSDSAVSNITATDSANHLYVDHKRRLNKTDKFRSLSLTFGLDVSTALQGTDDARYGSPYNTLGEFGVYEQLSTNSIPLGGRWSWQPGIELAYRVRLLDNTVKAEAGHLVLDDSHGALAPRQHLDYTSIGLPVTFKYSFDKKWHNFSNGFYFKLTPMVNFNQELVTQILNEHNHWVTRHDKDLDMLNRFNVRAAVGLNLGMLGFHSIEFFMDLLPTYKASAGAPQSRMFGLVYHF